MDDPTVFEFEPSPEPTELLPEEWEPVEHPEPVLLFRAPQRRWAAVPRRWAGSVRDMAAWRPALAESSLRARHSGGDEGRVVAGLTWMVAATCAAGWAVAGIVFWLPLVLRAVLAFALRHLQAMLDGTRPDAHDLLDAISFYARGFHSALDVARSGETDELSGFRRLEPLPLGRLARPTMWAAACWYVVLFGVGVASSPADLWQALTVVPWQDWSVGTVERMATTLQGMAGVAARASDVVSLPR